MIKSRITYFFTPKFRPFPTNTYLHKLWPFSTKPTQLMTHSPPPPQLFSQPKETLYRVASYLSPKTAPGKWAASSLSSCSLQWQLQGSKYIASAPESAPCHARRFHHQTTEKIYTCVQPDTEQPDKTHYIFNQNHEKQQQNQFILVLAQTTTNQIKPIIPYLETKIVLAQCQQQENQHLYWQNTRKPIYIFNNKKTNTCISKIQENQFILSATSWGFFFLNLILLLLLLLLLF